MKFLDYEMKNTLDADRTPYLYRLEIGWLNVGLTRTGNAPRNTLHKGDWWIGEARMFGKLFTPPISGKLDVIKLELEDSVLRARDEFLAIGKGD